MNAAAVFTVQFQGHAERRVTLPELVEANSGDEVLTDWAQQARVGWTMTIGGGAAPRVTVRRVA